MNSQNEVRLDRYWRATKRLWQTPLGKQLVVAIPIVLSLCYFYAFLASTGTFQMLPQRPDYYDRMAEGFRAGHLYIVELPNPRLLAKADPYAPENFFENLWLWDASLYKGHYYMYWGPVPGLLLLAWKVLTGYHGTVNDQWGTVIYTCGRLIAGTGLILGLAKHMQARPPTWLVAVAILMFGITSPIPFIVARPDVYEASLLAGQCFLFSGIWACFSGITNPRRRTLFFVTAGVMWGMAFGSRAPNIVPVPFIISATLYYLWTKQDRSVASVIRNALRLGLPFSAFVVAFGIYNYLRFDSPFEFGTKYHVSLQPFTFHFKYFVQNIYAYLFAPVKWSCSFPFVVGVKFRELPKFLTVPAGYMIFEKVAGILRMGGFLWLQLLFAVWAVEAFGKKLFSSSITRYKSTPYVHRWALVCSLSAIVGIFPALGLWEASMRYLGDIAGGMAIAASVAAFWLVRRSDDSPHPNAKLLARTLVIVLAMHSCFVGFFTAFAAFDEPFLRYNPTLYQRMGKALSVCE